MAKILKIFLLMLLAYGNCEAFFRIKYGQRAKEGQFPFYAQLALEITLSNGSTFDYTCGAALIHPQWLLSAGHCFADSIHKDDEQQPEGRMKVFMGSVKSRDKNAKLNYIERIYMHERFKLEIHNQFQTAYNDIALCKLHRRYELNRCVQTIRLPVCENSPKMCKNGVIVGMGVTEHGELSDYLLYGVLVRNSSYDDILNSVKMELGESGETKFYFPILNKTHIGSGDSGGPFVCYDKKGTAWQYGVVSESLWYVIHEEEIDIAVFEDITKYMEFIFQHIPKAQICGKDERQQWRIKKSGQSESIKMKSSAGRVSSTLSCFLLCLFSVVKYGH